RPRVQMERPDAGRPGVSRRRAGGIRLGDHTEHHQPCDLSPRSDGTEICRDAQISIRRIDSRVASDHGSLVVVVVGGDNTHGGRSAWVRVLAHDCKFWSWIAHPWFALRAALQDGCLSVLQHTKRSASADASPWRLFPRLQIQLWLQPLLAAIVAA